MTGTYRFKTGLAVVLAVALVGGVAVLVRTIAFAPTTITAVFSTATAIYPGDDVRIAGVSVGRIEGIEPAGGEVRLTMTVRHGVRVPADARAVIVAPNLVSARFVQLAPVYQSGPVLSDGAVIGRNHTAVPVEWDEVKRQLTRLATDLGPTGAAQSSSAGRFIDAAATALHGKGATLRETLDQLAAAGSIIAEGSGDITEIVKNLQTFVTVLRDSSAQVVQFQDGLASLSGVLDGGRGDLDAALRNLASAVGDVHRFVADTRDGSSEQVQRLRNVTQNLVDHRDDVEQNLHIAPNALANSYNMMDPRTGGASGVFIVNNLSNPTGFFCGMIGALENLTSPATAKLCAQYLGPGLETMDFNYLPFPFNPVLSAAPSPDKLIYTDPKLLPGAARTDPPAPPAYSAFTGFHGDVPPPPGYRPRPGPAPAPVAEPPALPGLLLPAEGPNP